VRHSYQRAIALSFRLAEPNLRLVVSLPGIHLGFSEKQTYRVPHSRAWLLSERLRAGLTSSRIQVGVSCPHPLDRVSPFQPQSLQADRAILPINLRMLPRCFSIPYAYLRTIEITVPILLVSLQIERVRLQVTRCPRPLLNRSSATAMRPAV